jgi:hypothetical protein
VSRCLSCPRPAGRLMQGTVTKAKRDESENGVYENEHGIFHRWLVSIQQTNGETIQTNVLRKTRDGQSESPEGKEVEQQKNGRWKVAASSSGGGGGRQTHPEDARRMSRCHAQEMALRYVAVKAQMGVLTEDFKPESLKPIIDWFDKDVTP